MLHMVNSEENMMNLKDVEPKFTVGYIRTLTRNKCGNWHSYRRRDEKLHHTMLSNMDVILGLQENLLRMTRELQNGFQVMSEGETLIRNKNSTKICFDKKMANNSGEVFLLTIKFYNREKNAAILPPQKRKLEGKTTVQLELTDAKKRENMKTKQPSTRKIRPNELNVKLSHTGQDRMWATANNLHYSIKGEL